MMEWQAQQEKNTNMNVKQTTGIANKVPLVIDLLR